jgi:hypothetical protein
MANPKEVIVEKTEVPALSDDDKFNRRSPGVPAVQADSPNAVIMMAMNKNYTPELIEKMMDLQQRHEENEARKLYVVAMAAFKSNPPEIEKDKTVSYEVGTKTTKYSHASLANAAEKINMALSVHQLSASWKTSQDNGNITVTCSITHSAGHSESTSLTAGPDTSGSKNSIQAIGSTISYLQRYTLLALTGLAAHDMDTDGATPKSEPEFITKAEAKTITKRMKKVYNDDGAAFLEWLEVETVDTIPAKRYKEAVSGLATAEKAAQKTERVPGQEG